jgi:carboxypeptidase C (cathepsin A)
MMKKFLMPVCFREKKAQSAVTSFLSLWRHSIEKSGVLILLLIFGFLCLLNVYANEADPSYQQSLTRHQGQFNGQTVDYTAVIDETLITNGENGPSALLVSISYLRNGVDDRTGRPVIFIFNGGPIVPSVYLHMAAFGPKRVAFPEDLDADPATFPLVDNSYTVLDAADLVFFDPAGTGFSRVSDGTAPDAYFSVEADARQLTQFIETWSRNHGRLNSPKYIFGESYGTLRAAVAAEQLTHLEPPVRLDGVFLMGQALNIIETSSRPGNIMGYVVSLPTLAALGWYHGRVERGDRTFEQFLDEVRLFARTEYLTALFQGNALSPTKRDRIAHRLAAFTGLPVEFYLQNDLRIRKVPFRSALLKDKNEVLGYYDGRYTAAVVEEGETPDASRRINSAVVSGFKTYVQEHLELDLTDYITDSPVKGLEDWKWGGATPFSDWPYMESIRKAMDKNPNLCVVIGAGYHDLTTTIGASEYAIAQSGWPKDRVRMAHYEGGHMAYSVEKSLKEMMDDVRALLTGRQ